MAKPKSEPMKAKEIQELINFISETGLEEVNIETEQFKLEVKRSSGNVVAAAPMVSAAPAPVAASAPASAPAATPAPAAPASAPAADNLITIKSPMIGTFYRSSSPDAPPLVSVGDTVTADKPVCIVEAMKLFNEIEAGVTGKIVEVLVENAQPVEFDQPLFKVDPS